MAPLSSVAFTLIATLLPETGPTTGLTILTVGAVVSLERVVIPLATFTATVAEAFELPAESNAYATRLTAPLGTPCESQLNANGAVLSMATVVLLTFSSTRATPILSAALTLTGTSPATVAPLLGDEIATEGACVSAPERLQRLPALPLRRLRVRSHSRGRGPQRPGQQRSKTAGFRSSYSAMMERRTS